MDLVRLPAEQLLIARTDPCLALQELRGSIGWEHRPSGANLRYQAKSFAVSRDGTTVDFRFGQLDNTLLRFDLRGLTLSDSQLADGVTRSPRQDGVSIETSPKFNGKPIELEQWDTSRSLAIDPNALQFVLGTGFSLRAFDAGGKELWTRAVPAKRGRSTLPVTAD